MRWRDARRSSRVSDYRGRQGAGIGGSLGLGGAAIVVVLSLLLGQNPLQMLALLSGGGDGAQPGTQTEAPINDEAGDFVSAILGDTEDVWSALFQQSGAQYEAPRLILFSGAVRSACGGATSATGPFYCPADRQVYLDTSFFDDMKTRLGGGGDFAEAYVIAHEVGHHVQTLTGVSARVDQARRSGESLQGAQGLSVRMELQADCFAGVWAFHGQQRHQWLEPGDIEEALNTATAIGDDRLQRANAGTVTPDSFTHGSSAQRVRWFRNGFDSGDIERCDTFSARQL